MCSRPQSVSKNREETWMVQFSSFENWLGNAAFRFETLRSAIPSDGYCYFKLYRCRERERKDFLENVGRRAFRAARTTGKGNGATVRQRRDLAELLRFFRFFALHFLSFPSHRDRRNLLTLLKFTLLVRINEILVI